MKPSRCSLGEVQIPQRILLEPSQSHLSPNSLSGLYLTTHTPVSPLVSATMSPVAVSLVVQEPACMAFPLWSLCWWPQAELAAPRLLPRPPHVFLLEHSTYYTNSTCFHSLSPTRRQVLSGHREASYSAPCARAHHSAEKGIVLWCVCCMLIERVHCVIFAGNRTSPLWTSVIFALCFDLLMFSGAVEG